MAKLLIEKWQCDRCGKVADKRPYGKERSHYEVRVAVDYETAGGKLFEWLEMCEPCDEAVAREIDAMQASGKAARSLPQATAREE